ncbi:N-acetylmuramoyl-L-alanine amidase [Tabrizicola thermarum]|uniref:N-acetylmuramoyl-L-alanine amidase n=1 Tax=Tabrizicola thermarum TaxID=2670345 RepID=UPI000FFC17E6|nr:N-acetylmuramoyl-L-alanine amidase [Tabrizicola thermarum]
MSLLRPLCAVLLILLALPLRAEGLSALARVDPMRSALVATGEGLELRLALSQPVPWRVRMLDNPPRMVIDTREVDWAGAEVLAMVRPAVAMRAGSFRPGWSRLVLELDGPHRLAKAEMTTGAAPRLDLVLVPTDAASLAAEAARPDLPDWGLPEAAELVAPVPEGSGPIVVVLDPGHGGIDPGAEREGQTEAALMLTFAREVKEALLRDGRFQVVLTRDDDIFVPLETRTSIAREAGADLFLSLHADALAEGDAQGATIYTLAAEASDAASEALAERHDRDDLLAGVDLTDQDDVVAEVLMDMARTRTRPRTDRLAAAIVSAIRASGLRMHRHPQQQGGFSVLKSPDIPSALLEVGFLSSDRDFKRLSDPAWRARLAEAVVQGIIAWSVEDAALRATAGP